LRNITEYQQGLRNITEYKKSLRKIPEYKKSLRMFTKGRLGMFTDYEQELHMVT